MLFKCAPRAPAADHGGTFIARKGNKHRIVDIHCHRESKRADDLMKVPAFPVGSAITRELPPASSTSCTRQMLSSNGADGKNFSMASFPTGISSFGRIIRSSEVSQRLHCSCSNRDGTRSPRPDGCGPG